MSLFTIIDQVIIMAMSMSNKVEAEQYKGCAKCFHAKKDHLYYQFQMDNNKHPCMKSGCNCNQFN